MLENCCHGLCAKHGVQCAASIRSYDRKMVRRAGFSPGRMYKKTIDHTHQCVQCLLDHVAEQRAEKERIHKAARGEE